MLSDEFQGLLPVDRMRVLDSLIGEASRPVGRNPASGASAANSLDTGPRSGGGAASSNDPGLRPGRS